MKSYWPQITFVLLFTFALGGSYMELGTHAEEIEKNSKSIELDRAEDRKTQDKLIRIETNQKNMKEALGEIKAMLKELRE